MATALSTETYPLDATGMLRRHLFLGASPEQIAERILEIAGVLR
ncbi:MAG: hypothetical protein V2B17_07530 [Chloroflexota bacterium]